MSKSIFPDRYFYCTYNIYLSCVYEFSFVSVLFLNSLIIATSSNTAVAVFISALFLLKPTPQFQRYLSSFIAYKCTSHIYSYYAQPIVPYFYTSWKSKARSHFCCCFQKKIICEISKHKYPKCTSRVYTIN